MDTRCFLAFKYLSKQCRISKPASLTLFKHTKHSFRKRRKQNITIDASQEQLFPTRRGSVLYEDELALSDKIRSARIAKKRKMHQITTHKHATLMFEMLQEALNNGRLEKANVTWKYLEYAPKFIDDGFEDEKGENELDNHVLIDLIDVGFEIVGVTMPNHRQFCVIWWKHNAMCKLNGGVKLVEKVLDLYRATMRSIIATKMQFKRAPRLIFRLMDDSKREHTNYHKEKMDHLIESALIEEYQKELGIDFKRDDTEEDKKYKNEQYHDMLMNKIYGDWRYDEMGNLLKPHNERNEKKRMADKWINTFLNKVGNAKRSDEEYVERKRKRKEREALRHQEKAKILNQILSTDAQYVIKRSFDDLQYRKRNDEVLISKKEKQSDVIIHSKPRLVDKINKKISSRDGAKYRQVVTDANDLDLVGFVE